MFDTAHLSNQQVLTLYGIITYLSVFPVLLLVAALAGYLRNRSTVRAGHS